MKKFLSYIFIVIAPLQISAQTNLIPNPGFEVYTSCPQFPPDGNIDKSTPWFQPNISFNSSDFLHICDTIDTYMSVPTNYFGSQLPNSGNGYSGIVCFGVPSPNNYREYLEVELIDTLKGGSVYNVSFYVSLGDSSQYGCNNIGVHFSDSIILYDPFVSSILLNLPLHIYSSSIIVNALSWQLVSGKYTALGGEKYLVVGNFLPDSLTTFQSTGFGVRPVAYYYFDDFNVSLDSTTSIEELKIDDIIISPNPSANVFTISTVNGLLLNGKLAISNLQGQQVVSTDIRNEKQFKIDLDNFANGVYLLKLQLREGIVIRKLVKM